MRWTFILLPVLRNRTGKDTLNSTLDVSSSRSNISDEFSFNPVLLRKSLSVNPSQFITQGSGGDDRVRLRRLSIMVGIAHGVGFKVAPILLTKVCFKLLSAGKIGLRQFSQQRIKAFSIGIPIVELALMDCRLLGGIYSVDLWPGWGSEWKIEKGHFCLLSLLLIEKSDR
jgi:hypothetical protein